MRYCPRTGKERFATRAEGEKAAKNMARQHKGLPTVYYCDECNSYHLTHYNYSHCRSIAQLRNKGFYDHAHECVGAPEPTKHKKRKRDKMKIFIESSEKSSALLLSVDRKQDAPDLLNIEVIAPESSPTLQLNYEQASELAEVIKIFLSKML